jgi:hypothetical protein
MTEREREQVVELLRCAADGSPDVGLNGMFGACGRFSAKTTDRGWDALLSVVENDDRDFLAVVLPIDERYREQLLEAALRVEQGELP